MATANIAVSTGTITTPTTVPRQADGTVLEGLMSTGGLTDSVANTAAGTGDLDANQGIAWSAQAFDALNQCIGLFGAAWGCAPRATMDRLSRMLTAMATASNQVPTGG
jgi:hypothetical protein